MAQAFIYKPARTAMQSGMAKTKLWVLELKKDLSQYVDPLMGWTGGKDTGQQVQLYFSSKEEAMAYASSHQLGVIFRNPTTLKIRPKSYGDNFKADKRR